MQYPVLDFLINYRDHRHAEQQPFEPYYFHYYRPKKHEVLFNDFTNKLADNILKSSNPKDSLSQFFLRFYMDDFKDIFSSITSEYFNSPTIRNDYNERVHYYKNLTQGHISYFIGYWIPTAKLKTIGNHPLIGIQGGFKRNKFLFDLSINLKFLKSPSYYFTLKNDSLYSTNHFFGGYFGAEVSYELIKNNSFELDLLAGAGYDGFDVLSIDQPNTTEKLSKTIGSANFSFGLGFKKQINNQKYFGIDCKYNLLGYKNTGGSNLDGNSFVISLKYGIIDNPTRNNGLRKLDAL
jgi:hypothetical protein